MFYLPISFRSNLKRLFHPLLFALIVFGILALYLYVWKFISTSFLSGADKNVVAAGITVTVSLASFLIAKHLEQQNTIRNEQREQKVPIYNKLMEFLFGIWEKARKGQPPTEDEINTFMLDFMRDFIIWGSDDVVKAFHEFRSRSHNAKTVLLAIENIFFMIRKDLGHKNKGIVKGMLLNLFITDIEEFLRK